MSLFEELAKLERQAEPFALCTVVNTIGSVPRSMGTKMVVFQNATIQGTIGGGELESKIIKVALSTLKSSESQLIKFEMGEDLQGKSRIVEVFIEPCVPKKILAVIGAGHVGRSVVYLATWLNFHVVLFDERKELCNPITAPGANEYVVCKISEIAAHHTISNVNYFVLTTKNSDEDIACLPKLLELKASYMGVIGSKVRWESTRQGLIQAGVNQARIETIHSPIGLNLGAETPEEIAVSIMAEIIATSNTISNRKLSEAKK